MGSFRIPPMRTIHSWFIFFEAKSKTKRCEKLNYHIAVGAALFFLSGSFTTRDNQHREGIFRGCFA